MGKIAATRRFLACSTMGSGFSIPVADDRLHKVIYAVITEAQHICNHIPHEENDNVRVVSEMCIV